MGRAYGRVIHSATPASAWPSTPSWSYSKQSCDLRHQAHESRRGTLPYFASWRWSGQGLFQVVSLPGSVQYNHKATRRKGQVHTDWYPTASAASRLAPIGAGRRLMYSCTCTRVLASSRRLSEAGDVPASSLLPGKSATHRAELPGGHSDW